MADGHSDKPAPHRPNMKHGHTVTDVKKSIRNMFFQRLREGRQNRADGIRGLNRGNKFLTLLELNRQLRVGAKFDDEQLLDELCRIETEMLEDAAQRIAEQYEGERERFMETCADSNQCLVCGEPVVASVMCDNCVQAFCGQEFAL